MKPLIILAILWPMVLCAQSPFEFEVAHTYPQGYHSLHANGNTQYAITTDSSQVHQLIINLPNGMTTGDTITPGQPAISLDVAPTVIFTDYIVIGERDQIEIFETGVNGAGKVETIPIDGNVIQVKLNLNLNTIYAVVEKNGQNEGQLIQYDPFTGSFVIDSTGALFSTHQVAFYDTTWYMPADGFIGTDLQLFQVVMNSTIVDSGYYQLETGPMQYLLSSVVYDNTLYITHDNTLTSHTLADPLNPVLDDSVELDFMGKLAIQDAQHFGIASPGGNGFQALQKDNSGVWQKSNVLALSAAKAVSAGVDYYAYATADSLYVIADKTLTARKGVPSSTQLSLYPNPTSDLLHLDIAPEKQSQIRAVEIIDINGRVVFSQQGLSNEISIGRFTNGLYVLKLASHDGHVISRRFVKQ